MAEVVPPPDTMTRTDSALARELESELNQVVEPPSEDQTNQWQCEACTTFNAETEIACTICYTTRMTAKDVAVTWEWHAEGETWIPYDLPTCMQVEEAYKQKLDRVSLTSGFFSSQPGAYEIQFSWEGREPPPSARGRKRRRYCLELLCWQREPCLLHPPQETGKCLEIRQFNIDTGNVRDARRIGDDDSSLFVPVASSALVAEDRCGVCQEVFLEEAPSEERDIVHLQKCNNHYFHRECISQWVKLKHTCPFCKTPI